jgi:hypothetical protein
MLFIFSLLFPYLLLLRTSVDLQEETRFYLYRLVFLQFFYCKNRMWNKGKRFFLHGIMMINGGMQLLPRQEPMI